MPDAALNLSALEPLFAPHEEPNLHRVRAKDGEEAGGAATGGTLYLTNIHRLHDTRDRKSVV